MWFTYKYRLKSKRTGKILSVFAKSVNFVWNYCVNTQHNIHRIKKQGIFIKWPSHFTLTSLTGGTSKDLGLHGQTIYGVCEQFVKSRDQHRK
jgi:putative transposase